MLFLLSVLPCADFVLSDAFQTQEVVAANLAPVPEAKAKKAKAEPAEKPKAEKPAKDKKKGSAK